MLKQWMTSLFLLFASTGICQTPSWFYGHLNVPGIGYYGESDILENANGDFFLFGVYSGPYKRDLVMSKMDVVGEVMWTKRFTNTQYQYMEELVVTDLPDGSVLVAWSSYDPDKSGVFKINTDGAMIWSREFPQGVNQLYSITADENRCFVAGKMNNQPFAAGISLDGQLLWTHIPDDGFDPDDRLSGWERVTVTRDGHLLFTGHIGTYDDPTHIRVFNTLVGMATKDGVFEWLKTGPTGYFQYTQQTSDGGWMFGGNLTDYYENGVVVRLDEELNVLWAKAVDHPDGLDLALLGLVTDEADHTTISLSGPLYGLGSYGAFCWAQTDLSGNLSAVNKISISNAERMAMNGWKMTASGDIIASGVSNKMGNGNPPKLSYIRLPADQVFPACCAEKDTLVWTPVDFSFENYETTFLQQNNWQEATFSIQDISNVESDQTCRYSALDISVSDTLICPGACVTFQVPPSADTTVQYQWTFSSGDIREATGPGPHQVCFNEPTSVAVAVRTINACPEMESNVQVAVKEGFIPNAFTPNGDQINDVFRPVTYCTWPYFHFVVYSRWGEKMFETNQQDSGWDGRWRSQAAPVDTYFWVVEYGGNEPGAASVVHKSGDVSLIR